MKNVRPQLHDVAICSNGIVGVIHSDVPDPCRYPDGSEGMAWTGVSIDGEPWSSRAPTIIARRRFDGSYHSISEWSESQEPRDLDDGF